MGKVMYRPQNMFLALLTALKNQLFDELRLDSEIRYYTDQSRRKSKYGPKPSTMCLEVKINQDDPIVTNRCWAQVFGESSDTAMMIGLLITSITGYQGVSRFWVSITDPQCTTLIVAEFKKAVEFYDHATRNHVHSSRNRSRERSGVL